MSYSDLQICIWLWYLLHPLTIPVLAWWVWVELLPPAGIPVMNLPFYFCWPFWILYIKPQRVRCTASCNGFLRYVLQQEYNCKDFVFQHFFFLKATSESPQYQGGAQDKKLGYMGIIHTTHCWGKWCKLGSLFSMGWPLTELPHFQKLATEMA